MDIEFNAFRIGLVGQSKHLFKQLLFGHRPATAVNQRGQHRQLTRRQLQRFVVQLKIAFIEIGQRAIFQRLLGHANAAAQQRANARLQFIQFERLGEIIVRPQVQPFNPIGNVGSGRQQQHR
ncbi:hypothetical protein D3C71_1509500 [compost metagenome]